MEADYTKRELDEHFKTLGTKIDENSRATGEKIAENTDLTRALNLKVGIQNGRVAKLEGTAKSISMAVTVAVVLIGLIISLIVFSFNVSLENLRSSILLEIKK